MDSSGRNPLEALRAEIGGVDLYLLDLLLRRVWDPPARVLDAGCGAGRNAKVLARLGFDVTAVDRDERCIVELAALASDSFEGGGSFQARTADVGALPFADHSFDAVACNAVLHFARSIQEFESWLDELFRVLRPGGSLFARLASTTATDSVGEALGERRSRMPNGMTWLRVDPAFLAAQERRLGAKPVQDFKCVVVHGQRAMGTWLIRKER